MLGLPTPVKVRGCALVLTDEARLGSSNTSLRRAGEFSAAALLEEAGGVTCCFDLGGVDIAFIASGVTFEVSLNVFVGGGVDGDGVVVVLVARSLDEADSLALEAVMLAGNAEF